MELPVSDRDEERSAEATAGSIISGWNSFRIDSKSKVLHDVLDNFTDRDLMRLADFDIPNKFILSSSTPSADVLRDMYAKRHIAQRNLATRGLADTGRDAEAERLRRGAWVADRLAADWLRVHIITCRLLFGLLLSVITAPIVVLVIGLSLLSLTWSGWTLAAVLATYPLFFLAAQLIRSQKPLVVGTLFAATLFSAMFGVASGLTNFTNAEPLPSIAFVIGGTFAFDLLCLTATSKIGNQQILSYVNEKFPQTALIHYFLSAYAAARIWEDLEPLKIMRLIWYLEDAAKRAEYDYARRSSSGDPEVRLFLDRFGTTIAAVLRAHKKLALEVAWADRGKVSRSLLNGIAHLLRGDPAQLLVVEAPATRRTWWERYSGRMALFTALVGGGMGLPLILPDLIPNPLEFRATAFVSAIFSLFAPDPKAAAEVLKTFKSQ